MTLVAHYEDLGHDLTDLIAGLTPNWTERGLAHASHYVEAGEYGLALETLAHIAVEQHRHLPQLLLAQLDNLADRMGIAEGDAMRSLHEHLSPPSRRVGSR